MGLAMANFVLDTHISKTPDFPKQGITFYDISPALEDPEVLARMIDEMANWQKHLSRISLPA